MRYFLLCSVVLLILTACGEDESQKVVAETAAQRQSPIKQIAQQDQDTPVSLSGSDRHMGPNPHAVLSSEQHIAVALQHVENGRIEQALDVLNRAIAASPEDASLIGTLGGLLLGQDRIAEALVYLEQAVTLAPDSAVLLVNRSQAYRKFNRYQEAMVDLDKAVSLSPELVPARFNRGVLYYGEGRYHEAMADFDVCVATAPETAGPYFNRAVTRDALGDQTGAVSDMKRFIELADNPEWKQVARETMASWESESQSDKQPN